MIKYLGNKDVVTRVPHKCWGCAQVMPKSTLMERCAQVVDGRATSNYWCQDCQKLIALLSPEDTLEFETYGIDCGQLTTWFE